MLQWFFLLLQSLLFLDQLSLLGKKSDVYILLKVLKYCTGSSVKSYQCKYAIDAKLHNRNPDKVDLCDAIKEVVQFPCLRGKFSSVHEDLMAEGISRVEVTEYGFRFHRGEGWFECLLNKLCPLSANLFCESSYLCLRSESERRQGFFGERPNTESWGEAHWGEIHWGEATGWENSQFYSPWSWLIISYIF